MKHPKLNILNTKNNTKNLNNYARKLLLYAQNQIKLKPGLRGLLCHPQVRKWIRVGLQLLHGAAKFFVQFTGWLFRITVPARACGDLLFTRKLEFGIIDLNVH